MKRMMYDQPFEDLLDILTRSLVETYHNDATKPGVTISYISDKRLYYVSANRYNRANAGVLTPTSVDHAYGEELRDTLIECIKSFKKRVAPPREYTKVLSELE